MVELNWEREQERCSGELTSVYMYMYKPYNIILLELAILKDTQNVVRA